MIKVTHTQLGGLAAWQHRTLFQTYKHFEGNSEVKQILKTVLMFLEDFLKISTDICSRKLLVVAE
jgi:hypothetical protein